MKFWKNENLSDRYIPSKQKKKLLYIIHDRRKMRGKFFFFIKTKIFDLQYIQINFLRLKQRTKICATDCYVISHRFFPRFFNRDSNALVTYRRSKRNSIINNSGQSSLVVISRSSIRGVERCSWCCAQHFSLLRVLSPRRETSLHPVCLQRGKLGNSVATIMN